MLDVSARVSAGVAMDDRERDSIIIRDLVGKSVD